MSGLHGFPLLTGTELFEPPPPLGRASSSGAIVYICTEKYYSHVGKNGQIT